METRSRWNTLLGDRSPSPSRLWACDGLELGGTVYTVHGLTHNDRRFRSRQYHNYNVENTIRTLDVAGFGRQPITVGNPPTLGHANPKGQSQSPTGCGHLR